MKNTKKAMIASAVCTVLCIFLLVSTSIAWFSSTKESQVNEIYSGNLDMRFYYSKDLNDLNGWKEVTTETTDIFKVGVNGEKDMLWEPGAANVVYLKLENKGSLSAKYDLSLDIAKETGGTNFNNESFMLSDYIMGGIKVLDDNAQAYSADATGRADAIRAIGPAEKLSEMCAKPLISGAMKGVNEVASSEETDNEETVIVMALVLYMPEESAEKTNYPTPDGPAKRPKVSLKLRLVTSQTVGEADGFGNTYDRYAEHPDFTANDAEGLISAVTEARDGDVIAVSSDITLTEKLQLNKNVTVVGIGDAAIKRYPTYIGSVNTVTFMNVSFDGTNAIDKASSVYATDFKGTLIFDGCTFGSNKWESVQITPAGNCTVVFRNCIFNGSSDMKRFIHIQPAENNNFKLNVTVTDCTFNNCDKVNYGTAEDGKGDVIDLDYFAPGSTITMGGNTFNLSEGVTNYQLHPYFCTSPFDDNADLIGDSLLNYLKGTVHTYSVTTSGLTE